MRLLLLQLSFLLSLSLNLPTVYFVGLEGPFPQSSTMIAGTKRPWLRAYFRFSNNHVAMRQRDADRCQIDYTGRYSKTRRTISFRNQMWTNARCILWISSDTTVIQVAQEPCPL